MDSAIDKNASGSQPRAQEAHIEASPVTLTPDGSVGSVANTDGRPSTPTTTTAPILLTPPAETQPQMQDLRICSKKCSGGPRPEAEFRRSKKPYGPFRTYKHCNECNRKYGRRGAPRLDIEEFRRLYMNPHEELHGQWLEEERRRREEQGQGQA